MREVANRTWPGYTPGLSFVQRVLCAGFDISLVKRLPLQAGVARTHIGFMGCQGALNGLRWRVPLLTRARRPVFCSVPLNFAACITSTVGTPTRSWPTPLFADGAAAAVAVGGEWTRLPLYQVIASGSTVIGDSEDVMTWRIGDHGFEMTLSPRVPDLICQYLKPWLESWLAEHELDMAQVGSWAVHPGGPRILSAVCEATGLDQPALEVSHQVLADHGNMSSPTILFVLDRLRRANAPRPCVALAFGPGLTVEAILLN